MLAVQPDGTADVQRTGGGFGSNPDHHIQRGRVHSFENAENGMLIATFVHPTGIFGIGFRVARDPADESGKFRLPHAVHIDDRLKDPHRSLGTVARVTFLSLNVDQIVSIHSAVAHARSPSARDTGNEERSA